MLFFRSDPPALAHYSEYRDWLRVDFRYRCAYCLTMEGHFPQEHANFQIDHHRPRKGKYARPDLEHLYINLYWTCHVCNHRKASTWPSPAQEAAGYKWIDPCQPWGDHDLHWRISAEGDIAWLTPTGEYTVRKLRLSSLKKHWQNLHRWQQRRENLQQRLATLPPSLERTAIAEAIHELSELIELSVLPA